MFLQALYENTNAVMVSNDTDLLILLAYIYIQKYRNTYNLGKIAEHYGKLL